jgi:hypothetical protein
MHLHRTLRACQILQLITQVMHVNLHTTQVSATQALAVLATQDNLHITQGLTVQATTAQATTTQATTAPQRITNLRSSAPVTPNNHRTLQVTADQVMPVSQLTSPLSTHHMPMALTHIAPTTTTSQIMGPPSGQMVSEATRTSTTIITEEAAQDQGLVLRS